MDTQVRTPQVVFTLPQRLVVPLFQRPYVWDVDKQWTPLWKDVTRVAARLCNQPGELPQPHFLGAVVFQQVSKPIGVLQERTIIDGQQRLTTLQLLLDAVHAELESVGATAPAARLEALVTNAAAFCSRPEDRFKVWPTNRDRASFNAVMSAAPPIDYHALDTRSLLVQAHRFFAESARAWLRSSGEGSVPARADALERAVSQLLQMVVIDLGVDEDAQEIFEALNDRGTALTAADLVKNFVFQRLSDEGADVDVAHRDLWQEFETGFWETKVSLGREPYQRTSLFINQWLIAQTGEEVRAREVFSKFKEHVNSRAGTGMREVLERLNAAAVVYRSFVEAAQQTSGELDRQSLFAYRTSVLESESIKPLVLHLADPSRPAVPAAQYAKALDVVESWLVRRMLLRLTSSSYTQVVAALIAQLMKSDRSHAGDVCEMFLREQTAYNWYWPDDDELRRALPQLEVYRRLSRGRLRMVLEGLEDGLRGYIGQRNGWGGQRVVRGQYAIEHVMPQKWEAHWPLPSGHDDERAALVHTVGNLTLLTQSLNSKVSNGPWSGDSGKRARLEEHDILLLNRDLLRVADDVWDESTIRDRGDRLTKLLVRVWSVPEGHRSHVAAGSDVAHPRAQLSDLVAAELLSPGAVLHAKPAKAHGVTAVVMPDGTLEVDGISYSTPSGAAKAVLGRSANGWSFWLVDPQTRLDLGDVAGEHYAMLGEPAPDELADEDDAAADGEAES